VAAEHREAVHAEGLAVGSAAAGGPRHRALLQRRPPEESGSLPRVARRPPLVAGPVEGHSPPGAAEAHRGCLRTERGR
ncbi:hypothetical protein SB717_39660, partial [Priestia sp. SIMBA_032]|uniref:hypothetical protein n=1 Tax=Priestia sp. SIMBA_032 TaxID=3085775 RepID=UPI00397C9BDA